MKKADKMKPTITKLVLEVNGRELSLSPDQAKELHAILDEMFGEKVVRHQWYQPWWGTTTTVLSNWTLTCGDSSASGTTSGGATVYLATNG